MAAMSSRHLTPFDRLLANADHALRTIAAEPHAEQPSPAGRGPRAALDEATRQHVAGLMRVNHAGEIAAQALYMGQALVARDEATRAKLERAAAEENDHLAWCQERLEELGARPSVLAPFWYAGSFAIGALAGLAGDRWSLGFVVETERQVEAHLDHHLAELPPEDRASRAVLERMKADEVRHADAARAAGGADLPRPVRGLMAAVSKVMTKTAYRV
jgi:ubiquinone biosynthesis monooxygenase Coq7